MARQRQGWYILPGTRNTPYFGPVPLGVKEIDPPGAPSAPAESVFPEPPASSARKAELVEWIESVTGTPLDGAAATKVELRAIIDELVEAGDSVEEIRAVTLDDEDVTDGEQLVDGESAGVIDADPDAGHEG